MARTKQYNSPAERQAAYRARKAPQKPPREDYLAALARSLHGVLRDAVEEDNALLPAHLLGQQADETLRNLIHYLDPKPDPFRPA